MNIKSINCTYCGKTINKSIYEYNRCKKLGQKRFYCNKVCSGKDNHSHLDRFKDNFKKVKYIRKPDDDSDFKWYMKRIRCASKQQKMAYNIDIPYLKQIWESQNGLCPFTNVRLLLRTHYNYKENKTKPYMASIDRIDNSRGYVKGNIRFVALIFNYARNIFSDEEVLEFCKQVASNAQKNLC